MKKRITGGLLAVCLLALAGCGSSSAENISAEEYVQKAHGVLEEADSFAATFHAAVQMKGSDKTVTDGTVAMVKDPLYMKVDTTLDFGDLKQDYDMYLEKTEDAVNQYMSYDGEWTEMTMDEDSALAGTQIYNTLYNLETIFSVFLNWTAKKDGGEIALHGVIPEAKFYDVEEYTRWFQLAGMSGLLFAVATLQMLEIGTTTDGVTTAHYQIGFWTAVAAVAFISMLGVVAGLAPALRAMSVKPVDAMRDE